MKDGGGEGGYCVLDISDGHWESNCRIRSVMRLGGILCSSRHRVKKVRFSAENSTFHLSRTLFLEGPNYVKIFFLIS